MLVEGEAREPLKSLPAPRFGEFRSIRKCDFVDLILIHGISEASEYKQYIIPKNRRLDLMILGGVPTLVLESPC